MRERLVENTVDKQMRRAIASTAIVLVVIVAVLAFILVQKNTPSKERIVLNEYYTMTSDEAMIILQGKVYEKNAKVEDDTFYLDLNTVKEQLNKTFYYDTEEKVLTVTTPTEIVQVYLEQKEYYSNKIKQSTEVPILRELQGEVYISIEFVAQYSDFQYAHYVAPNRLIIWNEWNDVLCYDTKKDTVLRVEASIKSDIIADISAEQALWYIDANGAEGRKFVKVMTEDGLFGFVKKTDLTDSYYVTLKSNYVEPEYTHITSDETIVLGWHVVTNMQANMYLESMVSNNPALNVISPTWFRLIATDGSISSLASSEYVAKAHALGLEVWGLIDNFASDVSSYETLSSTASRARLIDALLEEAVKHDLDGLNIDFEELSLETGIHYIQFLKELSVVCRTNGIVLSVDNYVPTTEGAYYDLPTQGKIVDYVVIMAYDEHYSGSQQAGSVASIGYVEQAIANTCAVMPKERVIMGIPFYTRLWKEKEENGTVKVTSEVQTMVAAELELARNGVKAEWDAQTAQYYAEYEKDSFVYKIWLEEKDSLREKLTRIEQADLAGIAAWRLGLEDVDVWDVILEYANK